MKEKLKEFLNIIICLAIMLGIGYSTGFLKDFSVDGIKQSLSSIKLNSKKSLKSNKKSISSINNYQPSYLPDVLVKSKYTLSIYRNISFSGTKAIFYIYDDTNSKDKDFHYFIQNYIARNSVKTSYNVYAYTSQDFKRIRLGDGGPSKICNSLQECNEQRQRAVDYTSAMSFFERCGRTMCVINPVNNEFIILKRRDTTEAAKLLNTLKNW